MDLYDAGIIGAWILLIVIPLYVTRDTIMPHLALLRMGIRGIIYTPLSFLTLMVGMVLALTVAEMVPILQWGWLGANMVLAPATIITEEVTSTSDPAVMATSPVYIVSMLAVLVIAILVMITCNYWEESRFRKRYRDVIIWALLHILMGIPLYAVIPIFMSGNVYKYVYDKRGVCEAYCAHFFTNMTLVAILTLALFIPV